MNNQTPTQLETSIHMALTQAGFISEQADYIVRAVMSRDKLLNKLREAEQYVRAVWEDTGNESDLTIADDLKNFIAQMEVRP